MDMEGKDRLRFVTADTKAAEDSASCRSMRQTPEAPCSRRARADARARVPAPPVITAFPSTAKRWAARSAGSVAWMGGSGLV